jgi:hypothetical protein
MWQIGDEQLLSGEQVNRRAFGPGLDQLKHPSHRQQCRAGEALVGGELA